MQEELISYNTAVLAKGMGFNLKVDHLYTYTTKTLVFDKNTNQEIAGFSAPSQSFFQKWLRKVHNIHVHSLATNTKTPQGNYEVTVLSNNKRLFYDVGYDTYEDALEHGLYEALKTIK